MNWFSRFIKNINSATWAAVLFFLCLFVLGIHIYPNYGISWDERAQTEIGEKNYQYVLGKDSSALQIQDRWYGPAYEFFLHLSQNKSNTQQLYLSRHRLIFLTFLTGCLFFYFLCKILLRNPWLALLGVLCLVVSPRIFADAFYNSKDIPFLVLIILGLWSMLQFLNHKTFINLIVHTIFSAALVTIRLPGLIIPALTLFGLIIEVYSKRTTIKSSLAYSSFYLLLGAGFGILIWPALWPDPLNGFIQAFQYMSHFPMDLTMLFMGKYISSLSLPWYYIPVWIGITTPVFYLICFVPGLITIVDGQKSWIRREISIDQRNEILILLTFLLPPLIVILIKSVLYDAWRQMFFIYPAFLIVSLKGMQWSWAKLNGTLSQLQAAVLSLCILLAGILPTGLWMIENHPYQNVYFNRLAGKDMLTIQQNYVMDYWGLSYREGLEALLKIDNRPEISVNVETDSGVYAVDILPADESFRIKVVSDLKNAEYFIGNYYLHPAPYPYTNEIYEVIVDNAKILSVFRFTEEERQQ